MTKAEFKALSDEEAFKLCFPGIVGQEGIPISNDVNFDINKKPYQLVYQKIGGEYANCCYCDRPTCRGCPIEYDSKRKVADCLSVSNHTVN